MKVISSLILVLLLGGASVCHAQEEIPVAAVESSSYQITFKFDTQLAQKQNITWTPEDIQSGINDNLTSFKIELLHAGKKWLNTTANTLNVSLTQEEYEAYKQYTQGQDGNFENSLIKPECLAITALTENETLDLEKYQTQAPEEQRQYIGLTFQEATAWINENEEFCFVKLRKLDGRSLNTYVPTPRIEEVDLLLFDVQEGVIIGVEKIKIGTKHQ